ncbi:hypothetical protein SAMN04488123_10559 [Natribacillus halophilus]|uniref:Uncharacterized protein n=1 Tax=Natribacillus halophilus TaxID=549003 RepID=A0A1G8MWA9_9BACI|nr:hypothetical protein SAMN04488123_10559 [Natribacillus halophilus]
MKAAGLIAKEADKPIATARGEVDRTNLLLKKLINYMGKRYQWTQRREANVDLDIPFLNP